MSRPTDREMTLRDYARVVSRRKWLVAAGVFTTVTAAVAMSVLQKPVYEASAQMLVKTRASETVFGNGNISLGDPKRAVQTEIKVLESQIVSQRVQQILGLDEEPPDVSGSTDGATDVVTVKVRSGNPTTARVVADAYVEAYIEIKREQAVGTLVSAGAELQKKITELQQQIDDIDAQLEAEGEDDDLADQRQILFDQQTLFEQRLDQLQVDAALATGGAQAVRQAEQPADPVEPTPMRTAALALVVGLLLGLGAAFLVDYLDDTVRNSEDLEAITGGLPVLAVVPVDPPPDARPIAISRRTDFAVEAYRGLRTSVQFISIDSGTRVVQVTSPMSGDGKTTTAANLAVVFAQAGLRTVLVDADLRMPRIHEMFSLPGDYGLVDVLLGEPLELAVCKLHDNFEVLPAGRPPRNPSEMLGSRVFRNLVKELAAAYQIVIIDSAPVLPVSDSVTLSTCVQGVLLVTYSGRTSNHQVEEALSRLSQVQAPVLGTVLNRFAGKGDGYGAYGRYGRYGHHDGTPAQIEDEP